MKSESLLSMIAGLLVILLLGAVGVGVYLMTTSSSSTSSSSSGSTTWGDIAGGLLDTVIKAVGGKKKVS